MKAAPGYRIAPAVGRLAYDKATFTAKIDLLLTHFIDMAVQGYGWVAA